MPLSTTPPTPTTPNTPNTPTPSQDAGLLALRLGLAAVMAAHGLLKLLAFGMPGTQAFFEGHGFPGWTAWPVMLAELAGAALLAAGILTRPTALVLIAVMLGALKVHAPNGWMFTASGGGWEYPAFLIAMLASLALTGPGRFRLRPTPNPTPTPALPLLLAALVLIPMLPGCASSPADDERLARNGELGRRYFEEVWNQGRVEVLDELLTPDYINHTPSTPNPPAGPEGLKPIVLALRRGFPDLRYKIKDMVVTADRVVLRVEVTGTNTGELFGVPPTGRRIRVNQINIEEVRGGRIAEHWRVTEERQLNEQLGK